MQFYRLKFSRDISFLKGTGRLNSTWREIEIGLFFVLEMGSVERADDATTSGEEEVMTEGEIPERILKGYYIFYRLHYSYLPTFKYSCEQN